MNIFSQWIQKILSRGKDAPTNHVRFRKGDLVCLKYAQDSFLNRLPLKIVSVVPDVHFEKREGSLGDGNKYQCISTTPMAHALKTAYQYELISWEDCKNDVLYEFHTYLEGLE